MLLIGSALVALACTPVGETELDADVELIDAEPNNEATECAEGTHHAFVEDELAVTTEAACIPDVTCDQITCEVGECLEEGGEAGCACPVGYEGVSCEACAAGFARDETGACTVDTAAAPQAPSSLGEAPRASKIVSNSGHRVQMESCSSGAGCVAGIPMTGTVSPLFREVDIAMRQFMNTHCIGSAVLAVARNGRRVYKRGFGRTAGGAKIYNHCSSSQYDIAGDYTLPDTPHEIGSVSKFVTAATVRELIEQRIDDRGLRATYTDASEALLLDPDLELLPPYLLALLDQTRADAVCPPGDPVGTCTRGGDAPAAPTCDGKVSRSATCSATLRVFGARSVSGAPRFKTLKLHAATLQRRTGTRNTRTSWRELTIPQKPRPRVRTLPTFSASPTATSFS